MIVETIKEAESFFLRHSSGSVCCKKDGKTKIVDCYPDAVKFFEE